MRLKSIDSLRGIAALAVALAHLTGNYGKSPWITAYGFTGVFLFFVISGFCIHLKNAEGKSVDFMAFWKRRWVRLYPAYIASFFLYLWWAKFNWFLVYDVIMHLLMLHNWDNNTAYSLNRVWWTLAIEEQLYLLYFVLLWMRRSWGWMATLAITFACRYVLLAISLGLHHYAGIDLPFHESAFSNWWIWALGAVSVEAYVGLIELPRWCYSKLLALVIFVVTAIGYAFAFYRPGTIYSEASAVLNPVFFGFSFFLLVNAFVRDNISFKWLAGIGLFSYSLYLTHEFVFKAISDNFFIGLGGCLIFAYVYYLVFEKPFMRGPVRVKEHPSLAPEMGANA